MVPLSSGNPYYYLSDHLGSASVIASGDGKKIEWDADYFPFGSVQNIFTNLVGNNYEFTGYENDSETGYNYANARFEAGRWGSFLSADPYLGSMDSTNPQSLNRYGYATENPIIFLDPSGLDCTVYIAGVNNSPGDPSFTAAGDATGTGGIVAYPYANEGTLSALVSILSQSIFGNANDATMTAVDAINEAAQTPGPINIIAFSGGAEALTSAAKNNLISPDILSRVQSTTYYSAGIGPGDGNNVPAFGDTKSFSGKGLADWAATINSSSDETLDCPHNFGCELSKSGVPRPPSNCAHVTFFRRKHGGVASSGILPIFFIQVWGGENGDALSFGIGEWVSMPSAVRTPLRPL
jgi:RHS repeat-associated protein